RTLERLAEHGDQHASAFEFADRAVEALGSSERVVLKAALRESRRGGEVVVGAHRDDEVVSVVATDVGRHPPGHRVDADHCLLANLDTLLGDLAVGQPYRLRRLATKHHLELREAEKK